MIDRLKATKGMEGVAAEIEQWREWSKTMPLDRLLQRIIDSPKCQFGYISETGGRQRIGNLNMLIDLTHRLSLGGMGLAEVHSYLRYSLRNEESAQAELPGIAKQIKSFAENISSGGLCFETAKELDDREAIGLRLFFYGGKVPNFRTQGWIAWEKTQDSKNYYGLTFDGLSEKVKSELEHYIESNIPKR